MNELNNMEFFESYQEIKKIKPTSLRDHLRTLALDGLSLTDRFKTVKKDLSKPRIQFLYVHHVFRDEEKQLEDLIRMLSESGRFISYSAAVNKMLTATIDQPYYVISSDDGFKNNLRAGEILQRYGISACFFINPALIDEKNEEIVKRHCWEQLELPPVAFLNWKEIADLQKMGHEIGAHTMRHMNVAKTNADVFRADCEESLQILTAACGPTPHFAFPYGRFFHFNETARKIVFESGFQSCATAERGCHVNHDQPLQKEELCILRDHIILDWKMSHIRYFLAKNSRTVSAFNNIFPYQRS